MIGLFVQIPLVVVLVLVVRKASKPLQASPRSGEDKEVVLECVKAFVYDLAACGLVWVFRPQLGATGAILGTFVSAILALMILLTVVDLPSHLKAVHNMAWRDGWVTPLGTSLTGEPVQVVRWGRRFAFVTFALFVSIAALVGSIGSSGEGPAAASDGPSVATSVVPDEPSAGASSPASTPAASPSSASCNAPAMQELATPRHMAFGTDLEVCLDGHWRAWSVTGVSAPKTADALAVSDKVGNYTYLSMLVEGREYTIRTLFYTAPGS
jgi:hypothetical protein